MLWLWRRCFDLSDDREFSRQNSRSVIADPFFYLVAIPSVILLGLGKGGFAGLGMISVPLLTFSVPTLQGAAIILPI